MPQCDGERHGAPWHTRIDRPGVPHALWPELEMRAERPRPRRAIFRGVTGTTPVAAVGAALILLLALTAALGWQAWHLLSSHMARNRGITFGDPPDIPLAAIYPLGVNTSLEAYGSHDLDRVIDLAWAEGVFLWARQTFPWSAIEPEKNRFEWDPWDLIVSRATDRGLRVIAVLDTSPIWARAPFDAQNAHAPPVDFEDYIRFAAAVAARYGDRIDHYQVWDQPNIYPHWGERSVDPAAYQNMLLGAYRSIHGADPDAVVLSAGLAPNVEPGGRNMSDLIFLQKMYDAGASQSFDVLAIKPYGFWWGPEDRRADPEITNFSRAVLAREVMLRNQDGRQAGLGGGAGLEQPSRGLVGRPAALGFGQRSDPGRPNGESLGAGPWRVALAGSPGSRTSRPAGRRGRSAAGVRAARGGSRTTAHLPECGFLGQRGDPSVPGPVRARFLGGRSER